jgi:hypothetical protein
LRANYQTALISVDLELVWSRAMGERVPLSQLCNASRSMDHTQQDDWPHSVAVVWGRHRTAGFPKPYQEISLDLRRLLAKVLIPN